MFGRPDAIFAPNPSDQKIDRGEKYDYVRPLATIEPTAISLGLPVNTSFGVSETDKLQSALEEPGNRNKVILIVWEHNLLDKMARALLASHGGDRKEVPREWDPDDFDSIYVIRLSPELGSRIRPYGHGGEHEARNGLLLRRDYLRDYRQSMLWLRPSARLGVGRDLSERQRAGSMGCRQVQILLTRGRATIGQDAQSGDRRWPPQARVQGSDDPWRASPIDTKDSNFRKRQQAMSPS